MLSYWSKTWLLHYFMGKKIEKLKEYLENLDSAIIAYSGGIDSSFLALMAHKVLGENAVAVTLASPLVSAREMDASKKLAKLMGFRHHVLAADILSTPSFAHNPKNRCYICKKALFYALCRYRQKRGFAAVIEGSNADDRQAYRPGLAALKELGIQSPLADFGFNKKEIRSLAKGLGLPNHSLPSTACLASRIPYGQKISVKKLDMISRAEDFIAGLGFEVVRVRYHNPIARIEVQKNQLNNLLKDGTYRQISQYLKKLGFGYITVDLDGFRSGSLDRDV